MLRKDTSMEIARLVEEIDSILLGVALHAKGGDCYCTDCELASPRISGLKKLISMHEISINRSSEGHYLGKREKEEL